MPRRPRIDLPGYLYHVIARGIEGREIYSDDQDREVFLKRLGRIILETETSLYSFALIPNHFHLLLRRQRTPIARVMQRLLTSYAIYFNKRHDRSGHLFQNRFRSIVCDENRYLLELVRYINLNPLRAQLVGTVKELEQYRYCSHGMIVGNGYPNWLDTHMVLSLFGGNQRYARKNYLEYIQEGIDEGHRVDLEPGGRKQPTNSFSSKEVGQDISDSRIIGRKDFITQVSCEKISTMLDDMAIANRVISDVCKKYSVSIEDLLAKIKSRSVTNARAEIAFELQSDLDFSTSQISRHLRVTPAAVIKMITKKRQESVSK